MSNNVLVKNSTYYSSSLNEGYGIAIVKNKQKYKEENKDISLYKQVIVESKKESSSIVNVCNALIINNMKNKEEIDCDIINFSYDISIVKDIRDRKYYDYPIISIGVNHGGISVPVFKEEESSFKDIKKISSCIIKDSFSDQELLDEVVFMDEINVLANYTTSNLYEKSAIKVVKNMIPLEILEEFKTVKSFYVNISEKETRECRVNTSIAPVIYCPKEENDEGYISQPVIEIDINNLIENGEGSGGGSNTGGDLDKLIFTIQQMSFFEFKLHFKEKSVVDIFNLPQGLFFDKDGQRIIGTPMVSGRFSFKIIFNNKAELIGIIEVPKINREL